ncbi:MAG TPA: DUF4349 domain-containing protein, partial [Anaerolinea sp.]|nr:DUF4349 domain-containing protein [Anaerolinea sp.]
GLFDFTVSMGNGGPLLQQLQMLPPGDYVLEGQSVGIEQSARSRPYWILRCQTGGEIGRVEVPNSSQASGRFQGTIRVPAERLDDAMNQIKALVPDPTTDILAENVTGQDVTKDYTDLKSRLVNLENTEKQLQKIMDQATKTEDVLAVYNQLVSVREQIEVIKGQIKYYEESAALSMIAVTLKSKAGIEPLSIGGWQPVGVARNALQTTVEAFKFLVNAAIWLVLFALPIGLLIFLPLRLLWWLIRRGRKNKPPVAPTAPPTNPENPA